MEEKEKFFLELIEGFEWKYDLGKYPNHIFIIKENRCLFQIYTENKEQKKIVSSYRMNIKQNLINKCAFWFNYPNMVCEISNELRLREVETLLFLKRMVFKHFKIKTNKIFSGNSVYDFSF